MIRYLLFIFSLFTILISRAQVPVFNLKKEEFKKAPERFYYKGDDLSLRQNRAVIFSDDFSNPSNWTMTNSSSPAYDWEIVNALPASLVNQNFGPTLNSNSGGNFAIVNSVAQGQFAIQNCNMTIVNSIDCSLNPTVRLRFENYHRIFYDTQTLLISNDGVNFDAYPVNENYGALSNYYTTSPNTEEVSVNITSTAGGQPTVWIRFNYQGASDWFWAIDDITLEDAPSYDIQCKYAAFCDAAPEPMFGQRIEHTILPISQNRPVKFLMDLSNIGTYPLANAKMKVQIENQNSILFFEDSTTGNTLNFNLYTDSLQWNGMSSQLEEYNIFFETVFDSINIDPTLYNNVDTLSFRMAGLTNDYFARDNNTFSTEGIWNGSGNGYIIASEFVATNNLMINSIDVAFTGNTDPGATICAVLYEYDTTSGLVNVVDNCLLGLEYTISPADISTTSIQWVHLPLSYTLQAGNAYLAGINYYGGTEDVIIMSGGDAIYNSVTNWLYNHTDATWYYFTEIPMIRMSFQTVSVNENQKSNNLSIFPNPSNETTQISFELSESSKINIVIQDLSGKTIFRQNYSTFTAGDNSISLDVSELNSGVYFCTLQTSNGSSTQKLVIEKW